MITLNVFVIVIGGEDGVMLRSVPGVAVLCRRSAAAQVPRWFTHRRNLLSTFTPVILVGFYVAGILCHKVVGVAVFRGVAMGVVPQAFKHGCNGCDVTFDILRNRTNPLDERLQVYRLDHLVRRPLRPETTTKRIRHQGKQTTFCITQRERQPPCVSGTLTQR